jgi:hypothetical protein
MADVWTDAEVSATVADYLEMLRDEVASRAYSKAGHRAELRSRLNGRTDASVEFKHQNISAVLDERGLRWIEGYRPLKNYQRSLGAEVDAQLGSDPELLAAITPAEQAAAVFQALVGNKAVEDAAIAWVMELELAAGRQPVDRRYVREFPGDIESPPRLIEIKASSTSYRGWFLPLETVQVERGRADPDFYVYVVENVRQGHPAKFGLKILHGDPLQALLKRATERHYFEVPWPVAAYDAAPGREALADS